MTQQTIGGYGDVWPNNLGLIPSLSMSGGAVTLDASGEKTAFIFQIPKSGNIDRLGFSTNAVTTSDTLRVGLQTVDATNGDPTGSAYGGSAPGTQASLSASTFYEVTLATPAAATEGDIAAIVIEFDSFVAGNLSIAGIATAGGGAFRGFPYMDNFVTGAWVKAFGLPLLSVRYDDGTYENIGALASKPATDRTYNSSSTPDEMGNIFQIPYPRRVKGFQIAADFDGDADVVLYDSNGTSVLASKSVDKDIRNSVGAIYRDMIISAASRPTLSKDTNYRLVVKPTTTTSIALKELILQNTAQRASLPSGTNCYKTSRTDAGSWTEDTTAQIFGLSLIFDGADDGAGSGSSGFPSSSQLNGLVQQ